MIHAEIEYILIPIVLPVYYRNKYNKTIIE